MSTKTNNSIPTWGEVQNAIENTVGIWYIEPKTLQGVSDTLYEMNADNSQTLLLVADVRVPFDIIANIINLPTSANPYYACGQIVSIIGNRTDITNQSPNCGITSRLYFSTQSSWMWQIYNYYLMFDISLTTGDWAFIDPLIEVVQFVNSSGSGHINKTQVLDENMLGAIKCSGFIKILN